MNTEELLHSRTIHESNPATIQLTGQIMPKSKQASMHAYCIYADIQLNLWQTFMMLAWLASLIWSHAMRFLAGEGL